MKRLTFLLLAAALAGCAQREDPATAGYRDPRGLFTLRGPASWRVLENAGGAQRVAFFGPPSGQAPFSAMIAVYYYSGKDGYRTPRDFIAARSLGAKLTTPPTMDPAVPERLVFTAERESPGLHGAPPRMMSERSVLIPAGKGFFALVHSAPQESAADTREAFDAVLAGFKPRS